jgi:predicted nucleic acid-binding protein
MYFDSAYLAKFYVNEPGSHAVRTVAKQAEGLVSSAWALAEVACALHRHLREGSLRAAQVRALSAAFLDHVDAGFWTLIPISERLLRRVASAVSAAPAGVFLRAGDALHLIAAQDIGEREIWTSDRHMLAAAPHFGLAGRSV